MRNYSTFIDPSNKLINQDTDSDYSEVIPNQGENLLEIKTFKKNLLFLIIYLDY